MLAGIRSVSIQKFISLQMISSKTSRSSTKRIDAIFKPMRNFAAPFFLKNGSKGEKIYLFTSGDDGKLLHFLDLSEDDEFPIILVRVIGLRKRKSHNSSQLRQSL